MTVKEEIRASKILSLALRHKPRVFGIELDKNGWVEIKTLLSGLKANKIDLSTEDLYRIVEKNDKKRFRISEDMKKIRASQGHSIEVDLCLKETVPPEILYHGTAYENLPSIKNSGLIKGSRHHVHLSIDIDTAIKVGARYGEPVVLEVGSHEMSENGHKFFVSDNGVWLTESVPYDYIKILNL